MGEFGCGTERWRTASEGGPYKRKSEARENPHPENRRVRHPDGVEKPKRAA
jgi:hypothetical protein